MSVKDFNYEKMSGCYLVTKHSWKGKYKRILSISDEGISTFNPSNMELTNHWNFPDFLSISVSKGSLLEFQITFKKNKSSLSSKSESMKFSSEFRGSILTDALKHVHKFGDPFRNYVQWFSYKYHWSETRRSVVLRLTPRSLDQLDPQDQKLLASYNFNDIEAIYDIPDYPGGFALKTKTFGGRLHIFASESKSEIISKIGDYAINYVGVSISNKLPTLKFTKAIETKFGKYSSDICLTSLFEFTVFKISWRHKNEGIRRKLCLSETCMIERDIGTYSIASLKPLVDICALVRHLDNPQKFSVQYTTGQIRSYTSNDRDSLLASFLDSVRASGNRDVCVRTTTIQLHKRIGPLNVPVEEEVESSHLKFLMNPPSGWTFNEAVIRFNANISYSGLLHAVTQEYLFAENKEKIIYGAINALINNVSDEDFQEEFHALRRLVASKAGFAGFTNIPTMREKIGIKVIKALKTKNDDGVCHAAIDMVCALMEPMHEDYDLRQEQLNKSSLLSSDKFLDGLLDMWINHINRGTGALVVAAMLDLLTFALCAPYSETTDGKQFDNLLEKVSSKGRTLFRLFQHPSLTIVKGAGLLMKALIEEGTEEIGEKMQRLALAEGSMPIHLMTALYTKSNDGRLLTHCQLSRHLIGLWVTDNDEAMKLLTRILPAGLLEYLTSDATTPTSDVDRLHVRDNLSLAIKDSESKKGNIVLQAAGKGLKAAKAVASKTADILGEKSKVYSEEGKKIAKEQYTIAMEHWRTKMGQEWSKNQNESNNEDNTSGTSSSKPVKMSERPIVLRRRREHIKTTANWPLFYYNFNQDHAKPNLIWNFKTRQELQVVLETEINAFKQDRELVGGTIPISWNYKEFEVNYQSFADEIKIGDYFLRLLLEEDNMKNDGDDSFYITNSFVFFNDLYHRFLLTPKIEMKCLCLQAMTIVYGKHHEEIGSFHDTKYIIAMLDRTMDFMERDRLLLFINKLLLNRDNAAEIVQGNGIKILTEFIPLAHLHTSRAVLNCQSAAIEANPGNLEQYQEKEWYYGNAEKERNGPVSFAELKELFANKTIHSRTKVWAQGLEGWRLLHQVTQLKWTLVGKGSPIMNESEVAGLVLNMFLTISRYYPSKDQDGAIVRPLPKFKTTLTDQIAIPHLVQILLTFDPSLVEKVSALLFNLYEDNPRLSSLYLTGLFFFILMYTGSNVMPIGNFLHMTHLKQAFRVEDSETSDIMRRSILGQMLPEAMVAYLENHGPGKFAQIFLGEFDTPEAIWNNEMRQFMIQKIAYHLADFTPRLKSNVKALYQYCPIPIIAYPALEHELFCDIYYLRNLCNQTKFSDWPISSPIKLLKEVLIAWKTEVDKKPSTMTTKDAMAVLGLDTSTPDQHDESKIRKSYFKMAQKYHPDKNPEGRAMFEKVNNAYQFLCTRSGKSNDGSPDPHNIVLILQTQSILFQRYSEALHPYKYAGYPMLIKTVEMETADDKLFSKSAPLLAAASDCAYHTVKCSALNAEELRRENGLEALYEAFERCIGVLSKSSKPTDIAVQVCTNITRCYSVASQFQLCLDKMVEMPDLVKNICRIFYYEHLYAFCGTAAECVSALAMDNILQMHLLQAGALWHLLLFMFEYDYTLEDGGVEVEIETNQQAVANKLAKLAVEACSRLAGLVEIIDKKPPKNSVIEECLVTMLTPYVVSKMKKKPNLNENGAQEAIDVTSPSSNHHEVLKILNSNTENPYLIWDNGTRGELIEYLKTQRDSSVRRGLSDPSFGTDFRFSAHKDELVVGDIFIRIYNQQPTFILEDPKSFTMAALDFLNNETQYLFSLISMSSDADQIKTSADKIKNCEMTLEALANVIKNNKNLEFTCIGHFRMIFNLLQLDQCSKVQEMALELLFNVTKSYDCVKDIASSKLLIYILKTIYSLPSNRILVLEILYALMADTQLVKECYASGGIIAILSIFCCEQDDVIREKSTEVLSRMIGDKLVGPKIQIGVTKFLPEIFLDAVKQSPATAIQMYESSHENPELIWNDETRDNLTSAIKSLAAKHFQFLKASPDENKVWNNEEQVKIGLQGVKNELVISGIYIRLFNENPGWVLRKPREFLTDLLEAVLKEMKNQNVRDQSTLEAVTNATVKLLEAQPMLCDYIPPTGYIARLISEMKTGELQKYGILIINEFANSSVCIESMSACDNCILVIKISMKSRSDLVAIICKLLHKLFEGHQDALVQQSLKCGLINDLLDLLSSPMTSIKNPSATKALIVKALKAMQLSLTYGSEVTNILSKSQVWSQYDQQKHDLFIEDRQTAGYLTNNPGVAGYLTSTQSNQAPSVPPPMDVTSKHTNDDGSLF